MFAAQVWVELITTNNWRLFPGLNTGPGLHLVWDINKHIVASAKGKKMLLLE